MPRLRLAVTYPLCTQEEKALAFWESKVCRVSVGFGSLLALVLLFNLIVFDYGVAEWNTLTWTAVLLAAGILLACCCLGGRSRT